MNVANLYAFWRSFLFDSMFSALFIHINIPKRVIDQAKDISDWHFAVCICSAIEFVIWLFLVVAILACDLPLSSLSRCTFRYLALFTILICLPFKCRLICPIFFFLSSE